MESMIESTRSTLNGDDQDEPAENKLEIFSNKPIVDDDLDVIILFLESSKQSGGGDITEFELNSNKRILLVNYQSSRAKKRVLDKKTHTFKDFKLIANEPFDETRFKLNKKAIILRNISTNMDIELVLLYAENLVVNDDEENDVEFLAASNLFVDTYYLRFKLDFDEDKLLNRLKKRMLNKKEVSFMKSFMTCTILVNQFDTKGVSVEPEMIEMYFLNKKRCGVENYISIRERDSFMLITFKDQESVYKILSNKHMIANQELVVEELVNFDLLGEEQIVKQAPKSSRSNSESEKGEQDQEEDVAEKKRAQEENKSKS
jgi:poly [ADP-ribose] polymerase 10/14/15